MTDTHELAASSAKSLLIGRHDGHTQDHLNCVALRHGWTRTFSIPAEEVSALDYETLLNILEVHTLKLRPVGVRVLVENPPDSGNWSKVRPWRHDGSLQSVLVQAFFEDRRHNGIITRIEVRDGADRLAEGDALSLRSVSSKIFHPRDRSDASTKPQQQPKSRRKLIASWFGFGKSKDKTLLKKPVVQEEVPEEQQELLETPKPSLTRSIFNFFRPTPELEPAPPFAPEPDSEEQKKAEEEILRKRGWLPPGLAKRQRSLRNHFRNGGGDVVNPFLGTSKSTLYRRKKPSNPDPFADQEMEDQGEGPSELTEQDVDDFFEIERPESMIMMDAQNGKEGKAWSRFRPLKEKRSKKKKGKGKDSQLSNGVEIVRVPSDALPQPVPESDVD